MDIAGNRTLYSILAGYAAERPDDPWLAYEREDGAVQRWTFREFLDGVHQAANFLRGRGVGRGQVVNLHFANHPAFPQLILAASQLGAIVLPSNPANSGAEIEYLVEHSETRLVITDAAQVSAFDAVQTRLGVTVLTLADYEAEMEAQPLTPPPGEGSAQCVVQLLYTSGTTSRPKGVMLTNTQFIYGAEVFRSASGLRQEDHHLIALPLFHAAAQCHALWPALIAGCRVTIVPRFSGRRFFAQATAHGATMAALFGAPLRILLSQPEEPRLEAPTLRNVTFAQSLSPAQYAEWQRRFRVPLQQLWGMTETVGLPLMSPLTGERRLGAMGRPVVGYEVKIVDEKGAEVPPGEAGQLIVRGTPGRSLMLGYLKNPAATGAALKTAGGETWLHTGDAARSDEEGFVYFVDRSSDVIKRGGENISSTEVEQVVAQLPAVADVAVVGVADPIKDEAVAAVVVRKSGQILTEAELTAHCAKSLAAFKVPTLVRFVETLPRTSVGKIQKHLIRQWFS